MKGVPCIKWTAEQVATLKKMRRESKSYADIATATGRTIKAVQVKVINMRNGRDQSARIHPDGRVLSVNQPTEDVLIERNKRLALSPRDLTAAMFGDPLPGYSALERRA